MASRGKIRVTHHLTRLTWRRYILVTKNIVVLHTVRDEGPGDLSAFFFGCSNSSFQMAASAASSMSEASESASDLEDRPGRKNNNKCIILLVLIPAIE